MGNDVRSVLASKVVLLDRMKSVSTFVKVVLEVGKEVAGVIHLDYHVSECLLKSKLLQLNGVAQIVFGLADKVIKVRSLL